MNQVKLFIGSSSESLDIVRALEYELRGELKTEVWDKSFRPGQYTLDELKRKAKEVDFAAFILGREDKTESGGDITISPRDNVVYEAGLFAGYLGVEKVFLLVDARGTKIPTDWKGLGYITYDPGLGEVTDAVHQAAIIIRKEIADWKKKVENSVEQQIAGSWWQFVVNVEDGSVLSLMNITKSRDDSTWKITGNSWTNEGKQIAAYWSRASAFDIRDKKLFYYWEGEHPYNKSMPRFVGVGEIVFREEQTTIINKAYGWYSETNLNQLNETVRKSTKYVRASEQDLQIMNDSDLSAIRKLLNSHLNELKEIYTENM